MVRNRDDERAKLRARLAELDAQAAVEDPDGHFPYAFDRATNPGRHAEGIRRLDPALPAEQAHISERIVMAEAAWRAAPTDEALRREYDNACFAAWLYNGQRRLTHAQIMLDEAKREWAEGYQVRAKVDPAAHGVKQAQAAVQAAADMVDYAAAFFDELQRRAREREG